MPQPQPVRQPPPVQRLRLRYAKHGPARFASHRDFARAFERALRRAGVPMAYSSGFSPHPRISYAGAAPTGAASQAEYLEIALARQVNPTQLLRDLVAVMPTGLEIVEVAPAQPGSRLGDLLQASRWLIDFEAGVPAVVLAEAVQVLAASSEVLVERTTKSGLRRFDVRAAIVSIHLAGPSQVEFVGRQGTPLVRPDDVVAALIQLRPALGHSTALPTRLEQGLLGADGAIADPFGGAGESAGGVLW